MADLVIIGQFEEPASITAVAVGSQIMHMVTVVLVGLSMGTTIAIARAVGKGEAEKVSCTIGQTLLIFGILSVVLAGFLINFLPRIVDIMATPPEAVRGDKTLSFYLLFRHSPYYGIQPHQLYLSGSWQFPDTDLFRGPCGRHQPDP